MVDKRAVSLERKPRLAIMGHHAPTRISSDLSAEIRFVLLVPRARSALPLSSVLLKTFRLRATRSRDNSNHRRSNRDRQLSLEYQAASHTCITTRSTVSLSPHGTRHKRDTK